MNFLEIFWGSIMKVFCQIALALISTTLLANEKVALKTLHKSAMPISDEVYSDLLGNKNKKIKVYVPTTSSGLESDIGALYLMIEGQEYLVENPNLNQRKLYIGNLAQTLTLKTGEEIVFKKSSRIIWSVENKEINSVRYLSVKNQNGEDVNVGKINYDYRDIVPNLNKSSFIFDNFQITSLCSGKFEDVCDLKIEKNDKLSLELKN